MSHTPTPWRHIKNTGVITSETARIAEVGDFRDKECMPHCKERWTADAKRIVACVNACDGLSISDVEEMAKMDMPIMYLAAYADLLQRQNDALLSAIAPWMNEIKATVGAVHMMDGFNKKPHRYDDMLVTLENAIKDCE